MRQLIITLSNEVNWHSNTVQFATDSVLISTVIIATKWKNGLCVIEKEKMADR